MHISDETTELGPRLMNVDLSGSDLVLYLQVGHLPFPY